MPRLSAMIPSDRFFARLDRFELECPNCGRLIFSGIDHRALPARLQGTSRRRAAAKQNSHAESVWDMIWNPYTQRLKCPWCEKAYHCGLVAFPIKPGTRRVLVAPEDTVLSPRHELEQRSHVKGWYAQQVHEPADPVNILLDRPCSCPQKGWAPSCPVHGDPAHGAPTA